jgi:BirA family biotin operon repressor/biotin-[acetyl-CoA-carboxylase] ligase
MPLKVLTQLDGEGGPIAMAYHHLAHYEDRMLQVACGHILVCNKEVRLVDNLNKSQSHKNFTIHHFNELESTNSHALELARLGKIFAGEIISADIQTSGRGRLDRKWQSPQGNLHFSLVLNPKITLDKIPQISFVAAVALRKTLEGFLPNETVENKWPNDVLINGKKIAGILLESEIQNNEARFVILGVGVNVGAKPDNVMFPATSLKELGLEITPENLLKNLLDEFENIYQNWLSFGFVGIRNSWLTKAFNLQKEITVKLDEKVLQGIFNDVDSEGNLLLAVDGEVRKISTADVS